MATGETDLVDVTVGLVSALLDSADVDTIGVANWWPRAQSALEAAAAGAETAGHAVTIAARKLQIDTLSKPSAHTVQRVAPILDSRWPEWVDTVAKEAVYIVALTRVHREESRAARKKPATTDDPEF